jgi:hypothetical protein
MQRTLRAGFDLHLRTGSSSYGCSRIHGNGEARLKQHAVQKYEAARRADENVLSRCLTVPVALAASQSNTILLLRSSAGAIVVTYSWIIGPLDPIDLAIMDKYPESVAPEPLALN